MSRVHKSIPTVGMFYNFYCNSISNDWLSFSKCGGAGIPCCYSKNLDSLKNWNNHFFWIDASICPIFVSWFEGLSVKRDPLPFDDAMDLPLVDQLNEGRALIRKYPEIDLLDFVKSLDPFKVKVGERTLIEGEILLSNETEDRVISPSNETLQLVKHAITDELRSVAGKRKRKVAFNANLPPVVKKVRGSYFVASLKRNPTTTGKTSTALENLITQSGQQDVGSELATAATDDFVSYFVTLTPKHKYEDESDENVKTRPAFDRYITEAEAAGLVPFMRLGLLLLLVMKLGLLPPLRMGNVVMCQNFINYIPPPGYWAFLHNQTDLEFLDRLNTNTAQHTCMVLELRLRYEHEIEVRDKLERAEGEAAELESECGDLLSKVDGEAKLKGKSSWLCNMSGFSVDDRSWFAFGLYQAHPIIGISIGTCNSNSCRNVAVLSAGGTTLGSFFLSSTTSFSNVVTLLFN
ncbi:hypothetical protein Tco_0106041 [Tanacetum coccineum]